MTKPEPSLLVVIKEPLSAPHVDHIPNTLQALQAAVGGDVESFQVAVGVRGDEFCSIPAAHVPLVLRLLKGDGVR